MGDPHNPKRYGEVWNRIRWTVLSNEIDAVKEYGVLSGGWAWHYISPPHEEEKHLHDHRDIDMHVFPHRFAELAVALKDRGYRRQTTRFDDPSGEFIRFEKYIEACSQCGSQEILKVPLDGFGPEEFWNCFDCGAGPPGGGPDMEPENVKVIFDLFVQEVPFIECNGYNVVEPNHMLTFYGVKHSSEQCVAVQAARRIQAEGGEIVDNPLLVGDYAR